MYKVFVNDKPIILTTSLKKVNKFPSHIFKHIVIEEVVYKLRNEKIGGINLYSIDLTKDWSFFLSKFEVISAAGGLVLNPKKEILVINRNQKWDLPKGKIEEGESIEEAAIREVEEECGISELKIDRFLQTTYHLYFQNGNKLKKTYWYLMNSPFKGKLTPQLEEGITEASFKPDSEVVELLKKSYANIQIVYNSYKENKETNL